MKRATEGDVLTLRLPMPAKRLYARPNVRMDIWDLHPLESAAFSRRTPVPDIDTWAGRAATPLTQTGGTTCSTARQRQV